MIGQTQRRLLNSLHNHKHWYNGCGWLWDTPSGTKRILDSLVKRGLVRTEDFKITPVNKHFKPYTVQRYVLTEEGERERTRKGCLLSPTPGPRPHFS